MDNYKAKKLEDFLRDKDFKSHRIIRLVNNGKSAAVFEAINSTGSKVAIKIFDNEMIERFGHEIQELRIEKEIDLKGHDIPNLVKIIDGGKEQIDADTYYYIIMEYIEGVNLKQYISSASYDVKFIQKVANVLLNVTENLLERGIVHRDIKPENVMITSNHNDVILMDLGVLKLIGTVSISDMEEKQFVGTLRYAPPEFLTRTEEDTTIGWRAVNFYQIGGIMHDLLMKNELFEDRKPYSNLVLAIKEDAPPISNSNFPYEAVQLARNLLGKDFKIRLELSSIEKIRDFCIKDFDNRNTLEKVLDDVFNKSIEHKAKVDEIEKINRTNSEKKDKRNEISNSISKSIDACIEAIKNIGLFTSVSKSNNFSFLSDHQLRNSKAVIRVLYKLDGELTIGFVKPIYLLLHVVNDENSLTTIDICAMLLSRSIKADLKDPNKMCSDIHKERNPPTTALNRLAVTQTNYNIVFNMRNAFKGTFDNDPQFVENLSIEFAKLIKLAVEDMQPSVDAELLIREKNAKNPGVSFSVTTISSVSHKTKIFI